MSAERHPGGIPPVARTRFSTAMGGGAECLRAVVSRRHDQAQRQRRGDHEALRRESRPLPRSRRISSARSRPPACRQMSSRSLQWRVTSNGCRWPHDGAAGSQPGSPPQRRDPSRAAAVAAARAHLSLPAALRVLLQPDGFRAPADLNSAPKTGCGCCARRARSARCSWACRAASRWRATISSPSSRRRTGSGFTPI